MAKFQNWLFIQKLKFRNNILCYSTVSKRLSLGQPDKESFVYKQLEGLIDAQMGAANPCNFGGSSFNIQVCSHLGG